MKTEEKLLIIEVIKREILSNLSFLSDLDNEEKKVWKEENKYLKNLLKCEDLKLNLSRLRRGG